MVDLSVGDVIGGYRVDGVAGQGGMAIVYRATDIALERPIALKVISSELAHDESFRERFRRESRLAASIRHPNVITVFRAGEEDGVLFIAMDYIVGTDLRSKIAIRGLLEPADAGDIVAQVGAALDAAHAKGLVHRDVKPANIMIADDRGRAHAFLSDFGLTKNVVSETGMTETGVFMGTVDYVAPEQLRGGRVDARTDVYALGCVLHEALTGQVPYPRDTAIATIYAHGQEPPPRPSAVRRELHTSFDHVVGRAMAKDPADRYPSAGDLGRAALAAVEGKVRGGTERNVAVGAAAPLGSAADAAAAAADSTMLAAAEAGGPTGLAAPAPAGDRTVPAAPPVVAGTRRGWRRRWLALGAAGVLLAAAALALALVVGGGGGGSSPKPLSRSAYQDQLLDAYRATNAVILKADREAPDHIRPGETALKAATSLARVRTSLDRFVRKVRSMTPPDDVKDLHEQLLVVFVRVREDVADAVAAADFVNDRNYRAALKRTSLHSKPLDAIGRKFAARGYARLGQQVST